MKSRCCNMQFVILVSAILFAGLSFAVPDEFDWVEEKYAHVHKFRDTGVYEDGGWLFVQVKESFDERSDNPKRKRMLAVAKASDLLKQWAIDYTAAEREVVDASPEGVKFAKKIIIHYLPNWQFRLWPREYAVHEIPYSIENGVFIYAQAVKKDAIAKSIPAAFSKPFAEEDWNEAIGVAIRKGVTDEGRESVVRICHAWDALATLKDICDEEYENLHKKLNAYYDTSDRVAECRRIIEKIETPVKNVCWDFLPKDASATTNILCVATTNRPPQIVCTTNSLDRMQSSLEVRKCIRSFGSKVRVDDIQSDEETVEVTETMTVVERKIGVRRKTVSIVRGRAEFERMFISKDDACIQEMKTTKIGALAKEVFTSSASLKQKEEKVVDALRENPRDAMLWNLLGKCLQVRGDDLGAIVCFKKSLRINHDYAFALVNLSEEYARMGYRNLAIGMAVYARALAKDTWCIAHAEKVLKKRW